MTKCARPDDDDRRRDEELGISQPITRRDLLLGIGVAVVGSMAAPALLEGCALAAGDPVLAEVETVIRDASARRAARCSNPAQSKTKSGADDPIRTDDLLITRHHRSSTDRLYSPIRS